MRMCRPPTGFPRVSVRSKGFVPSWSISTRWLSDLRKTMARPIFLGSGGSQKGSSASVQGSSSPSWNFWNCSRIRYLLCSNLSFGHVYEELLFLFLTMTTGSITASRSAWSVARIAWMLSVRCWSLTSNFTSFSISCATWFISFILGISLSRVCSSFFLHIRIFFSLCTFFFSSLAFASSAFIFLSSAESSRFASSALISPLATICEYFTAWASSLRLFSACAALNFSSISCSFRSSSALFASAFSSAPKSLLISLLTLSLMLLLCLDISSS
mmetsp:Transcript_44826/g.72003  ORF Transcript_44826/g.72003 Transcript_44826/m.72003 type:complete len:272 (-) Transcript_44826:948-1763(-)